MGKLFPLGQRIDLLRQPFVSFTRLNLKAEALYVAVHSSDNRLFIGQVTKKIVEEFRYIPTYKATAWAIARSPSVASCEAEFQRHLSICATRDKRKFVQYCVTGSSRQIYEIGDSRFGVFISAVANALFFLHYAQLHEAFSDLDQVAYKKKLIECVSNSDVGLTSAAK